MRCDDVVGGSSTDDRERGRDKECQHWAANTGHSIPPPSYGQGTRRLAPASVKRPPAVPRENPVDAHRSPPPFRVLNSDTVQQPASTSIHCSIKSPRSKIKQPLTTGLGTQKTPRARQALRPAAGPPQPRRPFPLLLCRVPTSQAAVPSASVALYSPCSEGCLCHRAFRLVADTRRPKPHLGPSLILQHRAYRSPRCCLHPSRRRRLSPPHVSLPARCQCSVALPSVAAGAGAAASPR